MYIEGGLEVDGTLYTDGGIDTAFTAGSVVFAGTSGVLAQDNAKFFFDDSTDELGLGTASPSQMFHMSGAAPTIQMTDTDTGADTLLQANAGSGSFEILVDNGNEVASSFFDVYIDAAQKLNLNATGQLKTVGTIFPGNNSAIQSTSYLSGDAQGIGIGTTDPANSLHVVGGIMSAGALTAAAANSVALSQESGYSRLIAFGPNATTAGAWKVIVSESDGGGQLTSLDGDLSGRVGVGGTIVGSFNGVGGTMPLTVYASSTDTSVVNNIAGISVVNTSSTTSNTSGLHFAFQDSDGTPNYISSSIVGIHGARTLGQYSTGQMAFLTSTSANTAPSEKMRLDNNGNLGIGTNVVDTPLQVHRAGSDSTATNLVHLSLEHGTNRDIVFSMGRNTFAAGDYSTKFTSRMSSATSFGSTFQLQTHSTTTGVFNTGMFMDNAGNVGIGTASPAGALHVTGAGADNTPNVNGVQISAGSDGNAKVEITSAAAGTPYIDFQNDISGTDYDARIILTGDDTLAFNGATTFNTDQTTATLFNTTATTVNFAGAATTLNINNGTADSAINIGSGAGNHTINIAGTGATLADTINIGTGGTTADTITIGNTASSTSIAMNAGTGGMAFNSQVVTGNAYSITASALTTGTGINGTFNALTTGTALKLTSTSITSGKFLDINNGSSIFSVSNTAFTTSLPTEFTSSGDVSIAYDLNFTNPTASYIKSAAPLYIVAGETFNSSNLVLQVYNQGTIVMETAATTGTAVSIPNTTVTTGDVLGATANALTSGNAFDISSSATAMTGDMVLLTQSGSNAANTGSVLSIVNSGTASTNTALYVKHYATGTNNLAFRVDDASGDTSPFVIDGTGAVGIGLTNPGEEFHVKATNVGAVLQRNNSGESAGYELRNESNARTFAIGMSGATGHWIDDSAANDLNIAASGAPLRFGVHSSAGTEPTTTAMIINTSGNVGIGTGTPDSLFSVNGVLQWGDNGSDSDVGVTRNALRQIMFDSAPTTGTGISVNIGTAANSNSTLVVNGNITTDTTLAVGTSATIGTGLTITAGSLAVNGDTITSDGDLTINPTSNILIPDTDGLVIGHTGQLTISDGSVDAAFLTLKSL